MQPRIARDRDKKDFPPDGKAWREYITTGREPAPTNNGMLAGLKKLDPTAGTTTNSPGVLEKMTNWARPEKQAEPTPQAPRTLPATLPTTPMAPNMIRRDVAPVSTPGVVPAGATRNAQGELIVPVTP